MLVVAVLILAWLVFGAGFVVAKLRRPPRRPVRKDRSALPGFGLQVLAFFVVFSSRRPVPLPAPLAAAAAGLALGSACFAWWAFHRLGKQLGIEAELVENHELVTTGPFAIVRHPVYTALLGLLIATGALLATWPAMAAGAVLGIAGTEWRVRVEERLLASRFGGAFERYRARVSAYLPYNL